MSVTDVHTHLMPRLSAAEAAIGGLAVDDDGRLVAGGHPVGPPQLASADALAAWIASRGIDQALVSVPPPAYRQCLTLDTARAWVRALNAGLREQVAGHDALSVLDYLPLEHPALAAEIARGLVADTATVGFTGGVGGASRPLSDTAFDPLWRVLDDAGLPLLLHPGASPDDRLDERYLHNLVGNPIETAVGVSALLLSDVLVRHPGLRLGLVHGGGVLPGLIGRMQRGVDTARPGVPTGISVAERARRLWTDCLTHDATSLRAAGAMVGTDHLLLGSDWPFPMGTDDPRADAAEVFPDAIDAIAGVNAATFLGSAR
ncbi:amidohydrolase family protein [Microbacterium radiodurans]|uniref:Amidohydrolase family protein n=1 Tax=Microbacterium radiodurans TaxID=661398 RepID=A0A5J5ITV1_9MICO|nr:amidohydrolase family protein [Microbacterium radiodurans]KAA9085449.1 amidohydrolase family protein [Microbacterium radiodurans]